MPYEIAVRGPGAGGPQTASSAIADILFCANQLAVADLVRAARSAGQASDGKGSAGLPIPVYNYGGHAFGIPQDYTGSPPLLASDDLVADFFVRIGFANEALAKELVGEAIQNLKDRGTVAVVLNGGSGDSHNVYLRTTGIKPSLRQMETSLEFLLRRFKSEMSAGILYLPIILDTGFSIPQPH